MKYSRPLLVVLGVVALLLGGYTVYLAAGGMVGREFVKATVARATIDPTYTLSAGPNGGDCARIGVWNDSTRTCALDTDLEGGATLFIDDDRVTLEGNGHCMYGDGSGSAISLIGNTNVVVRNLGIQGYGEGVLLQNATENQLRHLTIRDVEGHGIRLVDASHLNAIVDNVIGPAGEHGIAGWYSNGNFMAGNQIFGTVDAIRLQRSYANVILMNRMWNNEIEGVDLHTSRSNRVVLNAIHEEEAIPILDDRPVGTNLYSLRIGGNYALQFDEASEGCTDENSDGFCDEPYNFPGGVDERPLTEPPLGEKRMANAVSCSQ